MKKFLFVLSMMLFSLSISAKLYTVDYTTEYVYTYYDLNGNYLYAEVLERKCGSVTVEAANEAQAKSKAMSQCGESCNKENIVTHNGQTCKRVLSAKTTIDNVHEPY